LKIILRKRGGRRS
jgi:calpain, invertebrate